MDTPTQQQSDFFSNTDLLSGERLKKIMFLLRAMETIKCNKRDFDIFTREH